MVEKSIGLVMNSW